jgi:putative nucleotidyltransferase with HDIG domain
MDWDRVATQGSVDLDATGVRALDALSGCAQTAEFHGEGDVATHSQMVLDAANETVDTAGLSGRAAELLRLSALLHDVGKPATTVEVAPCRFASPRHAEVGATIVNELFDSEPALRRRGLADRAAVFAAVRAHMWCWHPERVSLGAAVRTAHLVDLDLLRHLWAADAVGRVCADRDALVDQVDWAAAVLDELVGTTAGAPWPLIADVCDPYELEPRVRRSVLRAVVTGRVTSAGAAAAHIAACERGGNGARIVWMCGPPGSGKSTWAATFADRYDAEVLTVSGARRRDRDLSKARNRRRLGELVAKGATVVVDATHIDRDSRDRLCVLADRYDAPLDCVLVDTPTSVCVSRQTHRARGTAVPAAAIRRMAANLRFPTPDEYSTLTVVDEHGEHEWEPRR